MPELKIKLTAGTNVGLVRGNNEDDFVVCRNLIANDWTIPQAGETTSLGPYGALLVVADGMGGANAGEVASRIAIETIQNAFMQKNISSVAKSDADIEGFMRDVTFEADKLIVKHSKKHKETQGMGTTLVMAWLLNDKAYICWCGDSRCYVFNHDVGLTRLSKDHSLVQQLVDKGELSPENAHNHPMSNVITQCLGNASNKISPDTRVYKVGHNDILLLCTDGLCGLCTDDEIMQVMVSNEDDVVQMKGQLIEAALHAGGYDNVTVAICHIDAPGLVHTEEKSSELNSTLRSDGPETTEPAPEPAPVDNADEPKNKEQEEEKPKEEPEPADNADEPKDKEQEEKKPKPRRKKIWLWVVLALLLLAIVAVLQPAWMQQLAHTFKQFALSSMSWLESLTKHGQ